MQVRACDCCGRFYAEDNTYHKLWLLAKDKVNGFDSFFNERAIEKELCNDCMDKVLNILGLNYLKEEN